MLPVLQRQRAHRGAIVALAAALTLALGGPLHLMLVEHGPRLTPVAQALEPDCEHGHGHNQDNDHDEDRGTGTCPFVLLLKAPGSGAATPVVVPAPAISLPEEVVAKARPTARRRDIVRFAPSHSPPENV